MSLIGDVAMIEDFVRCVSIGPDSSQELALVVGVRLPIMRPHNKRLSQELQMTKSTTVTQPSQEELNRLFWHSRRGMLELDVLLVPFSREVYPELTDEDKRTYNALLACEDADLFVWFMEKETPEDARLAAMVNTILERARSLPPVH